MAKNAIILISGGVIAAGIFLGIGFFLVLTFPGSSPDSTKTPSPSASTSPLPPSHPGPATTSTLEHKLAVIQQGGYVPEDDPLVMQFTRALDQLEAKCPESRQQLADMGMKGRKLLLGKNINEPLLEVFGNWRASIPHETQKGDVGPCSQILSAYIALRVQR